MLSMEEEAMVRTESAIVDVIGKATHRITRSTIDYDPLLAIIGDARFVLLGEASHGTHEFYEARAEITRRLIVEKGFNAVAVEADWPDAYRVNRYVQGFDDDPTALESLSGFRRFPNWMWRNADVLAFIEWLRTHNDGLPSDARKAGFYGLDLYSLFTSIEAVVGYLDKIDPEGAKRARNRYSCFEHFGGDSQSYGMATSYGVAEPCEDQVVEQLVELQRRAGEYALRDGRVAEDEFFSAEQNARLIMNAEVYYRSMFRGRHSSWNLRDTHMAETFGELVEHLERQGTPAKIVVWEHNSHLGDARATEMGERGELNVGQLLRERYGEETRLIGFTTYSGTVTAASDWDEPAERKQVRPALEGSCEATFHATGTPAFLLDLRNGGDAAALLRRPMLERAIGVIYRPETERISHYFHARLAEQFDAVIHFDTTHAVEPLDRNVLWQIGEPPETFPSGV
jgi:erythromycin esterase-like protein